MKQINKNEIYELKPSPENLRKPKFLKEIEFVTYNFDNACIQYQIENNKKVISRNIVLKKHPRKSHRKKITRQCDKTVKELGVLLNKVTNKNYKVISSDILVCVGDSFYDKSDELLEEFYNRVITEYKYTSMYVDILIDIKSNTLKHEQGRRNKFSGVLDKFIQKKFDNFCEKLSSPGFDDSLYVKKFVGICVFIGNLYNSGMSEIDIYLQKMNNYSQDPFIEGICKMFVVSGSQIEKKEKIFNSIVKRLKSLEQTLKGRIHFVIKDTLDFMDNNWVSKSSFVERFTETQQTQRESKDSPDRLISLYETKKLVIESYPEPTVVAFLETILDKYLDKNINQLQDFALFCKNKIDTNLTKKVVKYLEDDIPNIELDIPNAREKILFFKMQTELVSSGNPTA